MRIETLKKDKIPEFLEYCRKHRGEVDESFLDEEHLKSFKVDENNPTYIIAEENERIAAAASLIIDDYHRRGRKGRFRILHSEVNALEYYKALLQAVLFHAEGLDKIFVFVPLINKDLIKYISELEFNVERYSYLLIREPSDVPNFNLPADYSIKPFRVGIDENAWCQVRNSSFAHLLGSETPITVDMVSGMINDSDYIEGAMMVMYHQDKPIGVIRGAMDDYDNLPIVNIGPLAIIPEYQGKGLGRSLLRALLKFLNEHSLKRTILCVNAENERAKALYLQEDFMQVEGVVCLKYDLK